MAYNLSGGGQWCGLDCYSFFNRAPACAVSLWFVANATDGGRRAFFARKYGGADYEERLSLTVINGKLYVQGYDLIGSFLAPFDGITADTLYHAVGVLDFANGVRELWVNGVLESDDTCVFSDTALPDQPSSVVRIGNGGLGSTEYFSGKIEDVRLFNRRPSAAEIAAIYAARGTDYQRAVDLSLAGGIWLPGRGVPGAAIPTHTDFSGEVTVTPVGSPTYAANISSIPYRGGFGVRFDGVDDQVALDCLDICRNVAGFSFCGWLLSEDNEGNVLYASGNADDETRAAIDYTAGSIRILGRSTDAGTQYTGSIDSTHETGVPFFVAGVWDFANKTMTLHAWKNGVHSSDETACEDWDTASSDTPSNVIFIAYSGADAKRAAGYFASAAFAKRALSLPEIERIYRARGGAHDVRVDVAFSLRDGAPGRAFVFERDPHSGAVATAAGGLKYAQPNDAYLLPAHAGIPSRRRRR